MDRIIGQPHAVTTLRSALRSGRVHHAWIFAGPRGVGKFTTAQAFARMLLDPDAVPNLAGEIDSDPNGRIGRLIEAGSHPDFHVIRKELALYSNNAQLRSRKLRNIPLDILRESMIGGRTADDKVHEAAAYRTANLGHGKVFVIDEAELVDQYGQNSLLKTLEEPPADTYIILVTCRPEMLLPTIRSRCQLVRFGALDDDAMATWLDRQKLELAANERAWIELFAAGSPGAALMASEHAFHDWHRELEQKAALLQRGVFVPDLGERLAQMVDEFATAWVKANQNASKDAANKDGSGHVLTILASMARGGLRDAQTEADSRSWLEVIELLRDAESKLASNVNQKMVYENLVVQWTHRRRTAVV